MIDTHCHLNYPDFDRDRDAVVARAERAGVEAFVVVATAPENWQRTLDLAEGRRSVHVSLGVHPHEASQYSPTVHEDLKALAQKSPRVAAIGETGLDFFRNNSPRDKQFEAFRGQLQIAHDLSRPFILHCRNAETEMLDTLAEHQLSTGAALFGVWHCFTSTLAYAERAAAMGLYFGLGGIVTYPKAAELRDAVAAIPSDRILLETDCPFLPPQPWRGQRNEPSYLTSVVETLSAVRNVSIDEIKRQTDENARRLFRI